jgi:hypothetical protein
MYQIVGRIPASFGAVDTTEWWVGAGFFSQWAGDPPCPSGATLTTGSGCQYKGVIAEKKAKPSWADTRLDDWIRKRCSEGEYVMMTEPYYDEALKMEAVRVFSGPGAPARTDLGGQNVPPLTIPACEGADPPPPPEQCAEGEIMTAGGCVPEKELLSHLPPPCDDPDKVREMMKKVGIPVAMPDSSYEKKNAAIVAIGKWCQDNDIDCSDDQAVCDALVKGSSEAGVSTGTVVVLVAAGAIVLGGAYYLSRRKP